MIDKVNSESRNKQDLDLELIKWFLDLATLQLAWRLSQARVNGAHLHTQVLLLPQICIPGQHSTHLHWSEN
jgi:hypothetical protein